MLTSQSIAMMTYNLWLETWHRCSKAFSALKPSCARTQELSSPDSVTNCRRLRTGHVSALIPLCCTFCICFVLSEPSETPSGVHLQTDGREKCYLESRPASSQPQLLLFTVTLLRVPAFGNIWFCFQRKEESGLRGHISVTSSKPGAAIRSCVNQAPTRLWPCVHNDKLLRRIKKEEKASHFCSLWRRKIKICFILSELIHNSKWYHLLFICLDKK